MRVTLAEVRASYTPDKRWAELQGDFPSYALYRPLSFLLTPLFMRLGFSATGVTLLGFALAVSLPFWAFFGATYAALGVAATAFVVHVLDCVDGNIARLTGRATRLGALLDGFCDTSFAVLYFAAIGLLAGNLALALGLALLVILHRHLRDNYALLYGERAEATRAPAAKLRAGDVLRYLFVSLERLYLFALLFWGAAEVLLGIAAYVSVIFVGALWITFGAASAREKVG